MSVRPCAGALTTVQVQANGDLTVLLRAKASRKREGHSRAEIWENRPHMWSEGCCFSHPVHGRGERDPSACRPYPLNPPPGRPIQEWMSRFRPPGAAAAFVDNVLWGWLGVGVNIFIGLVIQR